ncbi:MAG TPA: hypothetical protein PK511_07800 [Chitinophagales bacterium]|nr:hypothetical protein [Chitinophagales bacterium]HNE45298.1 hypothetical protein [Chitinophagales bacterium]HNI54407.1 hypothetical protein [Chitinophagales bacterium]HNJ88488.1 hypothetical protein [Chitinophagales bacterium]HNK96896.1 hypothetical protein [Chitinophagales bacterium]
MNPGKLLTCAILCISLSVHAQTGYSDAGASANSMGNTGIANPDVFSAQNNQAAMAFAENASVGISTQNYFLMDEGLNAFYAAGIIPVQRAGNFGITAHYTGDATFNQTKIGLGYGRKLADVLAIGVQLDYVGTNTSEVGNGTAFTFDIGVLYKPTKTLSIGAKAFNPVRVKNGLEYAEELPAIITAGLQWQPSEFVRVCLEGEQNIDQDLRIKTGIEYHIIDVLYLRGGYISNPSMFTTGIGLKLKTFMLDAGAQFHQQLGVTPGVSLQYAF